MWRLVIKSIKKQAQKYYATGSIPKLNIKNRTNRDNIVIPNTHIHHSPLSWLGSGTSIKNDGFKLVSYKFN